MKQWNAEDQYRHALREILRTGTWKSNRTGIDSIASPVPVMITAHMDDGFPALTGRKVPFKSATGEMCGFMRGVTSAADFRKLGCKFWDQNANENKAWLANTFRKGEDDLGDVYGAQWRRWPAFKRVKAGELTPAMAEQLGKDGWRWVADNTSGRPIGVNAEFSEEIIFGKEIDQLGDCVRTIIKDPNNRRILFHAWNPAKLDEIALPACHLLYQFLPNAVTKELSLSVTIRSNDMPLGWPSNMMEAAILLNLVARLTGYKAAYLTLISNDAHIYRNQLEMVEEYLGRFTHPFPRLSMSRVPGYDKLFVNAYDELREKGPSIEESDHLNLVAERAVEWLSMVDTTDFLIPDYVCGEPISAPMAV